MPAALPIQLTHPLPAPEDLRFDAMSFSAGLSTLEEMQLSLLSAQAEVNPDELLGKTITVTLALRDDDTRHFNGHVVRFGLGRHQGRWFGYQATVVPWLWFLTRRSDCRIFQEMSAPDIIKKVFEGHSAIAKFEFKLVRQYRPRTYCVQYRETDFNFVARLMEDEGIYWYFEHTESEHKLIIVDASSAHAALPHAETLPYYANIGQASPDVDYVSDWNFTRSVETGKVALTSYDFERPLTALKTAIGTTHDEPLRLLEQFDYQGDYTQISDGNQLLDNRLDEQNARVQQLSGVTNAYALACGHLFTLAQHPRGDQNIEYLVVHTRISAQLNGAESGNATGDFRCNFGAIPSAQQFRPPRITPKPFVQGPQTAVVTGPAGEEIFTDKYGRVKVQFHWDRYGQKNEQSSCWIRVSSPWAGKSFGFIQIPRITQEVVVDFLEGDPDQPLITGRVYNSDQMPPWELPAKASQSGMLTRSTKGGAYGNANMLRFEDKTGDEKLELHAEKNMSTTVENDQFSGITRDRTEQIGRDRKVTIERKDTLIVNTGGRFVTVAAGGEENNITGGRKYTVSAGLDENTINVGRVTKITGPDSLTVNGNVTTIVNGVTTQIYNGGLKVGITGALALAASGTVNVTAGGASEYVGPSFKWSSPGNFEFFGNQFNRTVNQANDVFLGANTGTYMGAASDTLIAGARNTFVGIKNDLELALATTCTIGASINTSISAAINAGLSATIEMMAGPELVMGPLGLEQKSIDVAQSALKVITGGGGAGGGGGGGAAAAAVGVGAAIGVSVGAAIVNAAGAYKDIAEFLKAVAEAPNYGEARSALDGPTLRSMVATIFGAGTSVYDNAHPEQGAAAVAAKQEAMREAAERQAAIDMATAQAAAQDDAARARAAAHNAAITGEGG